MLTLERLSCKLGGFQLHEASFTVKAGDYFVLLGESGAGKTVVLELIAGLVDSTHGRVLLNDRDLTRVPIRMRDVGLVYQDHALFPHLSVRQNIAYALPRSRRHQVPELAEHVGATAVLDRRPATLSLGEAQRVALARTLARQPRILMLDEPLASLDVQSRVGIRSLLRQLNAGGQTIIHVTHDYEEAVALATRVGVLEGGRIVQVGTPDDIFHHPRSRFVAGFVGIKNFYRGCIRTQGDRQFFETSGVRFATAVEAASGKGCIVFESAAVTVSTAEPHGSARNVFYGTVIDVESVPTGVELTLDVGTRIYALITRASFEEMALAVGVKVWVSFKSSAIRFIPEDES